MSYLSYPLENELIFTMVDNVKDSIKVNREKYNSVSVDSTVDQLLVIIWYILPNSDQVESLFMFHTNKKLYRKGYRRNSSQSFRRNPNYNS